MRYTVKNLRSDQVDDTMRLITENNHFAHASKENSSPKYNYALVIDFLSNDSKEFDGIIESTMPTELVL